MAKRHLPKAQLRIADCMGDRLRGKHFSSRAAQRRAFKQERDYCERKVR